MTVPKTFQIEVVETRRASAIYTVTVPESWDQWTVRKHIEAHSLVTLDSFKTLPTNVTITKAPELPGDWESVDDDTYGLGSFSIGCVHQPLEQPVRSKRVAWKDDRDSDDPITALEGTENDDS